MERKIVPTQNYPTSTPIMGPNTLQRDSASSLTNAGEKKGNDRNFTQVHPTS